MGKYKQVLWTPAVLDEFLSLSGLDARKDRPYRKMMEMRCIQRRPQEYICTELRISRTTLNDMVRECKALYDAVQPQSEIMPPRQK